MVWDGIEVGLEQGLKVLKGLNALRFYGLFLVENRRRTGWKRLEGFKRGLAGIGNMGMACKRLE